MIGLSSLLMDEGAAIEPHAVREVGRGIFLAGQRLQEIISKFSLHTELQAAGAGRASGPGFDSGAAFVSEVVRAKAARLGREADLEVHIEDLSVPVPRDHLRPILEELVENALMFSPAHTPVVVRFQRAEGGRCLLSVSDRGRGMTAEQVHGLGTYAPSRRHDQEPGTGLGLAIVHRLAEIYGGQITFETAPGRGTMAFVWLPLAEP